MSPRLIANVKCRIITENRLPVVRHADVVQLFQHHREQRVHVSLVREVSVALLGLDNEHDVGGRRDVTTVEPQKFAFGDLRVVGHVTPVSRASVR